MMPTDPLFQEHRNLLEHDSAILPEVVAARGSTGRSRSRPTCDASGSPVYKTDCLPTPTLSIAGSLKTPMPPAMETNKQNRCPTCGRLPPGRPRAEVPVQNVLDALASGERVSSVARRFGVSRASVYRVMSASRTGA